MLWQESGFSESRSSTSAYTIMSSSGHHRPAPIQRERLCMDSSSFASALFVADKARLLTCIRSLYRALWHGTLMGYPRARSQLLCRALLHLVIHGFRRRRSDLFAITQSALQSLLKGPPVEGFLSLLFTPAALPHARARSSCRFESLPTPSVPSCSPTRPRPHSCADEHPDA